MPASSASHDRRLQHECSSLVVASGERRNRHGARLRQRPVASRVRNLEVETAQWSGTYQAGASSGWSRARLVVIFFPRWEVQLMRRISDGSGPRVISRISSSPTRNSSRWSRSKPMVHPCASNLTSLAVCVPEFLRMYRIGFPAASFCRLGSGVTVQLASASRLARRLARYSVNRPVANPMAPPMMRVPICMSQVARSMPVSVVGPGRRMPDAGSPARSGGSS